MAVNKVIYDGDTLVDLTSDTVTAGKMLSGITAHDKSGSQVTGTIATKTASNLTASGATVTVPAGYYASQATKSVTTASRANTTMSVSADDTNDKLTITASNNQSTGYVTGSNQTASKTITLTASGASVTASDGTNSVSKSVATATQATPSIEVSSAGLITASATQSAGYVEAGTKSATKQLTTQGAQTITPGTADKTIASGRYLTGTQTIKGDSNLVAGNIKSGVSIFGVVGSLKSGVSPQLIITAPNGSAITAVNGGETVTGAVGSSGTLTLDLPTFGTWTVTATLNGETASATVEVIQGYPIKLTYSTQFIVNGGHGETVRVYKDGVSAGTVTLNSSGTGNMALEGCKGKTIRFVGATSGYERSISVGSESQISVNVFPDGAIYWYGREFTEKTGGWVAKPNGSYTATLTKQQNYMVMQSTSSGSSGLVGIGTTSAMNLSKYKTMKIGVGSNPAPSSTSNKFGITSKYDASNWTNLWIASKTFGAAGQHSLSFSYSTGFPLFQIWPSSTFSINSVVFE